MNGLEMTSEARCSRRRTGDASRERCSAASARCCCACWRGSAVRSRTVHSRPGDAKQGDQGGYSGPVGTHSAAGGEAGRADGAQRRRPGFGQAADPDDVRRGSPSETRTGPGVLLHRRERRGVCPVCASASNLQRPQLLRVPSALILGNARCTPSSHTCSRCHPRA